MKTILCAYLPLGRILAIRSVAPSDKYFQPLKYDCYCFFGFIVLQMLVSGRRLFHARMLQRFLPKYNKISNFTTYCSKKATWSWAFHQRYQSFASKSQNLTPDNLTEAEYEKVADETLDSLWDYLDHIADNNSGNIDLGSDYDVQYAMGVLTVTIGMFITRQISKYL